MFHYLSSRQFLFIILKGADKFLTYPKSDQINFSFVKISHEILSHPKKGFVTTNAAFGITQFTESLNLHLSTIM